MKRMFLIVLVLGLCMFYGSAALAQTSPYTVKINAQDGSQPGYDTLIIGELSGATYGLDPSSVHPAGLPADSEYYLPPVGQAGVFDVRSVDFGGHLPNTGHDQGFLNDYRNLNASYYQTDTFAIKFQPSDANNTPGTSTVNFSWDSVALAAAGGGSWTLVEFLGGVPVNGVLNTIDMTTTSGVNVPIGGFTPFGATFYIISGDSHKFETFTYNRICTDVDNKGKWGKELKPGGVKKVASLTYPNVHDIGDQLFTLGIPTGLNVGSDAIRSVHLKKWADVLKNSRVDSKGTTYTHQNDSASCLWFNHIAKKGKKTYYTKKQLTALAPTYGKGTNNGLFAELMTLKINLAASTYGSTPTGLGNVVVSGAAGDLAQFNGMTLAAIATAADGQLSCSSMADTTWPDTGAHAGTAIEVANGLQALNAVFAQPDGNKLTDTLAYNGTIGGWNRLLKWPKQDRLYLTGTVSIKDVPYMHLNAGAESTPLTHNKTVAEPNRYALDQNYPNPFNPTTNIRFNLQDEGFVTMKVFNILGQEVMTLANREQFSAGENELQFNASNLPSGVYFYRITVNDVKNGAVKFMETHKMMLVK